MEPGPIKGLFLFMKRLSINSSDWLNQTLDVSKAGGLIIYPTETSYGLGADATNPEAITKLLAYKGNRLNKAISIAVADQAMAAQYIDINPTAAVLFQTVLPGPVTVIANSKGLVVPKVESERHTLGIRYSSYPLVQQLVAAFGKPITATSANTSGDKQIYSFADWEKYVAGSRQEHINLFLDAGKLPVRPPSTVVDTTLNNPEILRQGEIVFDQAATHMQSHTPEDTIQIGKDLILRHIDLLQSKPVVFALEGELGAGKTHFTKGIAEALNINETVTSPTYMIMREYPYSTHKVGGTLYHIDTWRLFEGEGINDLDIQSKLKPGTLVVIEWQQKASQWLASLKHTAVAYIKINTLSESEREIVIKWA
jgi:L-threonylcarbamoyladenylate synthase